MNINYHYFVVKTLAHTAGFSEEDAQTIAYYSQQVDDFTKSIPIFVTQKPPAFFLEKKYAEKIGKELWMVMPHPTGIDVTQSLEEHYRHTTLAPFHFIPSKSFSEIDAKANFSRADYRCVRADNPDAALIQRIVEDAVKAVQKQKCEKSLMQLAMAVHTYADTYAHYGYSGLEGWENSAIIKKAYNQMTGKEEVPSEERFAYRLLPHIGHGNTGHVPDTCTYKIDVAMRKDDKDSAFKQHIVRDNLQEFLACAKAIFEILCHAAETNTCAEIVWDEFQKRLATAMQVPTEDESKKDKLITHWSAVFPEITYTYTKNERFYQTDVTAEIDIIPNIDIPLETTLANAIIDNVTDAFYMFNELAYRRAELVLGSAELLIKNAQLMTDKQSNLVAMEKHTYNGDWEPQTDLGRIVYTAGFAYHPDKDIICSTMNNVQRAGGYCKGYDEAAITINSVIDCEPIYFCYNGYEWLIELWKGQYGIETGCEIGTYYREQDKPLSIAEKTVLGDLYHCVADEDMLDLRFALKKEETELFARDWTKHWWLTGFHWGIFSEPEQLTMTVGIRFPNREMLKAFIQQGIDPTGYNYTEADDCSVEFCFAKPKTPQPAVRNTMRKSVQLVNQELVKSYNSIREKYGITENDPNVINGAINEQAGVAEKKMYEKLFRYFNRKAGLKNAVQNQIEKE